MLVVTRGGNCIPTCFFLNISVYIIFIPLLLSHAIPRKRGKSYKDKYFSVYRCIYEKNISKERSSKMCSVFCSYVFLIIYKSEGMTKLNCVALYFPHLPRLWQRLSAHQHHRAREEESEKKTLESNIKREKEENQMDHNPHTHCTHSSKAYRWGERNAELPTTAPYITY